MATTAAAHVKWFINCNASENPLPVETVLTTRFFGFLALFLGLLSFGCVAERTASGAMVARFLNLCTARLHSRADDLLRAVVAISFALLWAQGGLILTPELKESSISLAALQLLIPMCLFTRPTVPVAGAAIIATYGYGVIKYGLFHMLDYPVFIGIGTYFILSVPWNDKLLALRSQFIRWILAFYRVDPELARAIVHDAARQYIASQPERDAKLLAFRSHFLRWTLAFSLLWPSMEKFVYPSWVAEIATVHPELTLGFPVALVITASGIVEFGLSFALFWTPLVRRLAAVVLIVLLSAATIDFGKIDGIGHLMIITVLLMILGDPGGKPERCHPAMAPLVGSVALLATICLYTGGHALYYGGTKTAGLAWLMSGVVLQRRDRAGRLVDLLGLTGPGPRLPRSFFSW